MKSLTAPTAQFVPSRALRELRARMHLANISVATVSTRSKVPYSVVSMILGGRRVSPVQLDRIRRVVMAARIPEATV